MSNHPNRSKQLRFCIWCYEGWTLCHDKHGNRYHVAINIRCVEPCRTFRTQDQFNRAVDEALKNKPAPM